mmetsp:Transcript_18501/g.71440  ORF Transcript_18501/g.71440 Transcript_18501/m.71440 type:complete len:342 (-) Transcript_18501:48-1073(-)
MHARALDANEDAQVRRRPLRVGCVAVGAEVVAGQGAEGAEAGAEGVVGGVVGGLGAGRGRGAGGGCTGRVLDVGEALLRGGAHGGDPMQHLRLALGLEVVGPLRRHDVKRRAAALRRLDGAEQDRNDAERRLIGRLVVEELFAAQHGPAPPPGLEAFLALLPQPALQQHAALRRRRRRRRRRLCRRQCCLRRDGGEPLGELEARLCGKVVAAARRDQLHAVRLHGRRLAHVGGGKGHGAGGRGVELVAEVLQVRALQQHVAVAPVAPHVVAHLQQPALLALRLRHRPLPLRRPRGEGALCRCGRLAQRNVGQGAHLLAHAARLCHALRRRPGGRRPHPRRR